MFELNRAFKCILNNSRGE
jgi:hypothetical protein